MYVCTIASRVDGREGAPGVAFCKGKRGQDAVDELCG